MPEIIRLGCLYCDRTDYDGVNELPAGWEDIHEIQSVEEAYRPVTEEEPQRSVLDWETHLGVCPECQTTLECERSISLDPTQTYLDMFNAMNAGDLAAARQNAVTLRDWLEQGGFYPPGYSKEEINAYLNDVLRRTATYASADNCNEP